MFSNFKKEKFTIENSDFGKADITFRHGGKGEPLLLLHGNPMSHITWHKVADSLKEKFYVVASDLRGYGESIGPEDGGANHIHYSFRAMASDQVLLMKSLGFEKVKGWECLYVHREDQLFLSVYVDDFKLACRRGHTSPPQDYPSRLLGSSRLCPRTCNPHL